MKLLFGTTFLILSLVCAAQDNLFYIWEPATQTLDSIGPFPVDLQATADTTMAFEGYLPGQEMLSELPPLADVFPGTNYLEPSQATLHVDPLQYPARSAVKLFGYVNGVQSQIQSGSMIGERFVMTAGHGIMDPNNPGLIWYDSILVAPAFDNGMFESNLPTAISHRFYLLKEYYLNATTETDICLLELADPIGWDLGWSGIGFNTNDAFFDDGVFHKFSWPQVGFSGFDFNGDTMIYSYGTIAADQPGSLISPGATAFPGESGSAWIRSVDGRHHAYGIAQYSGDMRHLRFSPEIFYGIEGVLDQFSTVSILELQASSISIWPQPANEVINISGVDISDVQLFDLQGRSVRSNSVFGSDRVRIDVRGLDPGIYVVHISNGTAHFSKTIVKL